VTLFPEGVQAFLGLAVLKIASEKGLASFEVINIRDSAKGRHRQVDDRPFGGGPGMLLMPGPVVEAVENVRAGHAKEAVTILLTPQGRPFHQRMAEEWARKPGLILVAGRYEGFDERIVNILDPVEVSLGDFVLAGGELAALAVAEAVVRLLPGVLGDEESARRDSFQDGLLEGPQYTRPRSFRGLEVPDVLLSGNHEEIAAWRLRAAQARTRSRRGDLFKEETGA